MNESECNIPAPLSTTKFNSVQTYLGKSEVKGAFTLNSRRRRSPATKFSNYVTAEMQIIMPGHPLQIWRRRRVVCWIKGLG
jgi:hypothetical protein